MHFPVQRRSGAPEGCSSEPRIAKQLAFDVSVDLWHAVKMTAANITVAVSTTLYVLYFIIGTIGEKKQNRPLHYNIAIATAPENSLPKFVTPGQNTTVTVGDNALLACIVDFLQSYKVAWIKVSSSSQTILTTHQFVITNDSRVSLSYNDHRSWYLHIREVKEDDRGWYICQVNTQPITSQSMYLQVLVPPKIIEDMTSNDVVVRELTDVTLHCRAVGYPEPYVMWRRADGNDFIYNGEKVNVVDGEKLQFRKISRLHIGTYYCVAQNGIPPPTNKKISITVHFPPILHVPNQLVGAALNQQVTLHCISEAYPKSINYWTRENGEMIMPESKYEVIYKHDMYTTNMIVNINAVSSSDFGTYTCVSINPLGNTDGVIKLYEITPPLENEWKTSFLGNETEGANNLALDDEIVQLNSTSTATKCRLDTLAASLLCVLSEVYKITKRYASLHAVRIKTTNSGTNK